MSNLGKQSRLLYGKLPSSRYFAQAMLRLTETGKIQIWGGCCGTDDRHMECLAKKLYEAKNE